MFSYFFKIIIFLVFIYLNPLLAQIPSQLSLEDIQIKGESTGAKILNITPRKKNNITERISIKSSFKSDILESLPEGFETPETPSTKKDSSK